MSRLGFYVSFFQKDTDKTNHWWCLWKGTNSVPHIKRIYTHIMYPCKLIYYFGVSYPDEVDTEIANDIKRCNCIVIAGFDPDTILLDAIKRPVTIACFENTNYIPTDTSKLLARLYFSGTSDDFKEIIVFEKIYRRTSCNDMSAVCSHLVHALK
jgi:hypothetical protein